MAQNMSYKELFQASLTLNLRIFGLTLKLKVTMFDVFMRFECLIILQKVDSPHMNSEIGSSSSKNVFSILTGGYI